MKHKGTNDRFVEQAQRVFESRFGPTTAEIWDKVTQLRLKGSAKLNSLLPDRRPAAPVQAQPAVQLPFGDGERAARGQDAHVAHRRAR